jgi:hypothetical protein
MPNWGQTSAPINSDEEWTAKWGATKKDVQNALTILASGKGWIGRLEKALEAGAILPAVGAGLLIGAAAHQRASSERGRS